MARHVVGRVSELPPGSRKIVEVGDGGRTVGVFNVNGQYHALLNRCPHQAAPLCRGAIKGMAMPSAPGEYVWDREGEILRCPWHGWEFDLTNGRSIFNPHKLRVRTYAVTVEALPDGTAAPGEATSSAGFESDAADEERVETFPVTVEDGWVILHA
jgi:3-phenylpropionate/trans-cinnamate dioxygenase ferredoxin subunit